MRAISELGRELQMEVVAEWVETAEVAGMQRAHRQERHHRTEHDAGRGAQVHQHQLRAQPQDALDVHRQGQQDQRCRGTPIVVFNLDGELYALEDQCTHEEFELSSGEFNTTEGSVECVLHGARFDVRDGRALCAPRK